MPTISRSLRLLILTLAVAASPRALGAPPAPEPGPAVDPAPLCGTIARGYEMIRGGTDARGAAADRRGPLALGDVLDSGVTVSKQEIVLTDASKIGLWARTHRPPIALPEELAQELASGPGPLRIRKLPGVEYYAASTIQGTALCYHSVYFTVQAGRARAAPGPTGWETGADASGCGVERSFGTVDGVPVAYQTSPGRPRMGLMGQLVESLTVSPWRQGRFGPACTLELGYAPRFSATELTNDWEQTCAGPRCAALRSAALAIAADVQAGPHEALQRALGELPPGQRSAFEDHEDAFRAPDELTDGAPLVLPWTVDGALYRVTIGHVTIGWRIFSDWRVTFEDLSGGTPPASLAVGMGRGALVSTSVR